jgi:uncharacterized protein (TIGR00251 family)
MINITEIPGGVRFEVKVQPRSSKNQVAGEQEGVLKIKLTAPPVDGEANQALIAYLSDCFKVPKKNISLLKGDSSRHKLLEIKGVGPQDIINLLPVDKNLPLLSFFQAINTTQEGALSRSTRANNTYHFFLVDVTVYTL